MRLSIARPSGSLAILEGGAAVCSPIIVRPKKTSGEVHAATARRMWFVRNESPTWYAAAQRGVSLRCCEWRGGVQRTVHPAESFAGDHLEVDALIAVLGVDEVRKPDSIELLWNDAVKVDECGCHPVPVLFDQHCLPDTLNGEGLHVKETIREALGIFKVAVTLEPYPRHDLMWWPCGRWSSHTITRGLKFGNSPCVRVIPLPVGTIEGNLAAGFLCSRDQPTKHLELLERI
jgi:hypothetical protein